MAGKKAATSYLVYEPHNCDNSQKKCWSVVSILEAVTSEKQQNCSICDKYQKNCRSVISILEAVRSEEKQNCSIWDNSYRNCRSVVSILVALTSEKQQNSSICDNCQKDCRSVVSILKVVSPKSNRTDPRTFILMTIYSSSREIRMLVRGRRTIVTYMKCKKWQGSSSKCFDFNYH